MDECGIAPVSVVIPCFRCGTTIGRAIASIAAQTQKPAEVLLVDDASGDETSPALQQLVSDYPGWVKLLVLDHNQGPSAARNAGWEAATQPYLAFLDADDSWHPEKIRIQYEFMQDNPDIDVSGHRCLWVRADEALPQIADRVKITNIRVLDLVFGTRLSTPTIMLKRSIPFRFEVNTRYAEDLHLWRQVACANRRVVRIESPLAYMHKAPYGVSGLSAELWPMEKGELSSLHSLYKARHISWMLLTLGSAFSIAKHIKRITHVQLTRTYRAFWQLIGSRQQNSMSF
jgi:glycosyltransferase involved in cell wall biosynthesis